MRSAAEVQSWRAIEALRAGVPNRDAVQGLGSAQAGIEERFRQQLVAVKEGFAQGTGTEGTLIAGDFGAGKSHLLEYLQHIALEHNFVCSKVVVSKETPLYDPTKVYHSAMQSARVPDRAGAALVAVAQKLNFNSPQYGQFSQWINHPGNELSPRFAATVCVFERGRGEQHPEVSDRIIQFWSGGRLAVAELRSWLRELGEAATYQIDRVTVRDLALQRYRFIPHLMVAAGYAGWVILFDEVEIIGRYSLRQRAKSYAEVGRLLGKLAGSSVPGLTAVLAITSAFESEVLGPPRDDEEKILGRLRAGGSDEELHLASQVERGIRIMQRDRVRLEDPNEATSRDIYQKLSAIYAKAYGWDPPMEYRAPDRTARIRQHVKRWINEWDLERLYPGYKPDIEVTELRQDYSERPELEVPTEDGASEGAAH